MKSVAAGSRPHCTRAASPSSCASSFLTMASTGFLVGTLKADSFPVLTQSGGLTRMARPCAVACLPRPVPMCPDAAVSSRGSSIKWPQPRSPTCIDTAAASTFFKFPYEFRHAPSALISRSCKAFSVLPCYQKCFGFVLWLGILFGSSWLLYLLFSATS